MSIYNKCETEHHNRPSAFPAISTNPRDTTQLVSTELDSLHHRQRDREGERGGGREKRAGGGGMLGMHQKLSCLQCVASISVGQ